MDGSLENAKEPHKQLPALFAYISLNVNFRGIYNTYLGSRRITPGAFDDRIRCKVMRNCLYTDAD